MALIPGNSGPAPTPKATLEHRGSWRASLIIDDAPIEAAVPLIPEFVKSDYAKKFFIQTSKMLLDAKLITHVDGHAMGCFANLMETYVNAQHMVGSEPSGLITMNAAGTEMVNPAWRVAHDTQKELQKYFAYFGMTPAARSRVKVAGAERQCNKVSQQREQPQDKNRFFSAAG